MKEVFIKFSINLNNIIHNWINKKGILMDKFILYDVIEKINKKSKLVQKITPKEISDINFRISKKMKRYSLEFKIKINKSMQDARHFYVN